MVPEPEPPDTHLESRSTSEIEALELYRRSPHPYHRQKHELRSLAEASASSSNDFLSLRLRPPGQAVFDEDGRTRGKLSQSPSDSGTEADDEGYGFIKALPAPPLRPHKGLRVARGTIGDATPLLTPSQVDEEGRKVSEYFKPRREGTRSADSSPTDAEARVAREKYLRRRRNEVIRRTTETVLLAAISVLAVTGCSCWEKLLLWHRVDLLTHALVMAVILVLYPLRLLYYSWKRQPRSNLRLRQRIRIPAAFDPAPILYPAIIPVLISISLFPTFQKPLLPNILLGLAALPPQLIPYETLSAGYSSLHWVISILPLAASENTDIPSRLLASIPYKLKLPPPEQGLHPEVLVLLFPLHQALLPPLHYLTTTSLLPAELHLLSVALINLLLFTESPQASILRILLWLGGVGVFVLCGKVLKWGVALARIPRWRFRRAGQIIKARQSFLQLLSNGLKPNRSRSRGRAINDSDADEDGYHIIDLMKKGKRLKLNVVEAVKDANMMANGSEIQSAIESKKTGFESSDVKNDPASSPRRRNTLPSLPSQCTPLPSLYQRRRAKSIAQSFLALTPTQALLRKWLYASYFYMVVAALILGPIRHLSGKYALNDHEPFGWAIGYLFGNAQRLRFQIFNWNLDNWAALPALFDPDSPVQHLPPASRLRAAVLGAANVRLLLCLYCMAIIAIGLLLVLNITFVEVDTRRKVFHGMMVAMLLPTIFIDPCFISLALILVLAVFLLLDLIRASQLPPLSGPIATFLTPYVDGRDLRGPVVVSHIFLLIGCAIPLWLSLAGAQRVGEGVWQGWDIDPSQLDVSMVAGVVCVGMGDAAASLIGRRYGRRKWPWAGGKSLEGSAAFAGAVTIGLVFGKAWLALGWRDAADVGPGSGKGVLTSALDAAAVLGKAVVCALGASLEEAVLTGGNDNVVVPVVLWVLVRGVRL